METTINAPVDYSTMSIDSIARVIRRNWTKVYFGAVPYLAAMAQMNSVSDNYGYDTGSSVVLYFLANANTWKGPVAREVKKELKRRCK